MTKDDKRLLVKIRNPKLNDVFGFPLMLQYPDEDDKKKMVPTHANVAVAIRTFLRAQNPETGRTVATSSHDDAVRVQTIGVCLQKATNNHIELPVADLKWLRSKAKEFGHLAFITESAAFCDALEDELGAKENRAVHEVAVEE